MEFKRLLNEYLVDGIFKVNIYRSILSGYYLIVVISIESGQIKHYDNIEAIPTFGMIETYINLDFNYGK